MKRIYIEITNMCNLSCSFCHGTSREGRMMSEEEFRFIADNVTGRAESLFFHVMGEPLLHPQLPEFIKYASGRGFKTCVTTNGTLLPDRVEEIISAKPYKVSISLHSQEANGISELEEYLHNCTDFAGMLAGEGGYCALRLWNSGGEDRQNEKIISIIRSCFPGPWVKTRSGYRVADRIFIESGERFEWPDPEAEYSGDELFCYGLRDQIAILVDGTVVPCCLDADGNISLGNIFENSLEEIMSTDRARRIYDGFTIHKAVEELCKRCGYAAQKAFRK